MGHKSEGGFVEKLKNIWKNVILWYISLIPSFFSIFFLKWLIRNCSGDGPESFSYLKGKTALITGGNSGIGYATSLLLASRGCRVIIACRRDATLQKESIIKLTGNTEVITKHLDLSKFESVRKFASDILESEDKIDVLVNNAGIAASSIRTTEDGLNTMMQVNYFGHVLLTYLLLDKLKMSESPKVIFLSSILANISDLSLEKLNETNFEMNSKNTSGFYANSKLCNILAAQELGEELKKYKIKVNSLDPGVVKTPIYSTNFEETENPWSITMGLKILLVFFRIDLYSSARSILFLASSSDSATSSHYFRSRKLVKPKILSDRKFCVEIWKKTKELIGVE